jgi:DNA polymerase-3 subunit epsilon
MCGYLGIELDHHNALSDALGCLQIAVNIMNLTGLFDPEEMLESCGTRIYEL